MRTIIPLAASVSVLTLLVSAPPLAAREVPVAVVAPHVRLLALQGGRNVRDLGGYRTVDGRTTKWGLLFRSGSMHSLTLADYHSLEGRRIQVICDFRSTEERKAQPANWPSGKAPVLADD